VYDGSGVLRAKGTGSRYCNTGSHVDQYDTCTVDLTNENSETIDFQENDEFMGTVNEVFETASGRYETEGDMQMHPTQDY